MKVRLTRQRWGAIMSAMAYYETVIQDENSDGEFDLADWREKRRRHELAMEWLRSVQPGQGVTR